ncbi:hypothetical protein LguiB_021359 [Lonicera macranthoides]
MVEGAVRIYSVVLRWKLNFHPLACLSSTRSIVLFDKVKYKKMLEKVRVSFLLCDSLSLFHCFVSIYYLEKF